MIEITNFHGDLTDVLPKKASLNIRRGVAPDISACRSNLILSTHLFGNIIPGYPIYAYNP